MERNELTEKEAVRQIERTDKERRDFMQHHYKRDIRDPHGFDVTLNIERISIEKCVDVVLTAYRAKFDLLPG